MEREEGSRPIEQKGAELATEHMEAFMGSGEESSSGCCCWKGKEWRVGWFRLQRREIAKGGAI